jgi:hypothetical protein
MGNPVVFLLQTMPGLSDFQIQPKPVQGVVFVVGLVVVVLIIVYLNKSKKVKNSAVFRTGTIDKTNLGALAVKGMMKVVRKYGLDAVEQKALVKAMDNAGLSVPDVFNSVDDINNGFSRMITALNREDDAEQTIANLFSIRNKIEYYLSSNMEVETPEGPKVAQRRYRRVKVNIPISFYHVSVNESRQGLKKTQKLSLDAEKLFGNMLDISAGGCSVKTRSSVKAGSRIKVEFKHGKTSVVALAMILRVNDDHSDNVLHARFIKVPVKTLNAINALVYNYRDI